ncbi:MAG: pyridoxine 5'-phosphate synthase [Enterobacteriaceae bacterium]
MNKLSLNINNNYVKNFDKKKKFLMNLIKIIFISKQSGINNITINLKKNDKYINEKNINILKKIIQIYINIKTKISDEILDIILKIKPQYCFFILDEKTKISKIYKLKIIKKINEISIVVNLLNNNGIKVSLFIDPDLGQIDAVFNTAIKYIEINTKFYSSSKNNLEKKFQLNKIKKSIIYAKKRGLIVNLGNGLNYENIKNLIKIKQINKINIGNAIFNESMILGLKKSIKKMLLFINNK